MGRGSVGRILSAGCPAGRSFLWAQGCPCAQATYPHARTGRPARTEPDRVPIRCCSGWGLACHRCRHRRGELLPHHFTLASPDGLRRYLSVPLSVAFSLSAYDAWPLASTLSCGVRTFLQVAPATVRPAPRGGLYAPPGITPAPGSRAGG